MGRTALCDQECQHLLVSARLPRKHEHIRRVPGQQIVDLGEVGTEPAIEPVTDPVDLAKPAPGTERRAVDVVERHLTAMIGGVGPVPIGAQTRGDHLAQLLLRPISLPAR